MKVCIECKKELKQTDKKYAVKYDRILNLLVYIKKLFKAYKGNELYVCANCYETYKKKRDKFIRNMFIIGTAYVLFLVFLIVSPFLFGTNVHIVNVLMSFLYLNILLGVMAAWTVITSYRPALKENPEKTEKKKSIKTKVKKRKTNKRKKRKKSKEGK